MLGYYPNNSQDLRQCWELFIQKFDNKSANDFSQISIIGQLGKDSKRTLVVHLQYVIEDVLEVDSVEHLLEDVGDIHRAIL